MKGRHATRTGGAPLGLQPSSDGRMAFRGDGGQHGLTHFPGGNDVPYSLVSAATLGFDLVRLPSGHHVAEVLLTGLNADAATLERLVAAHPGRETTAEQRGVLAVRSRRARELASGVPHVSGVAGRAIAAGGEDRTAVLVSQLERGMIGNAPTLERLLRDDVLGSEHVAAASVSEEVRDQA